MSPAADLTAYRAARAEQARDATLTPAQRLLEVLIHTQEMVYELAERIGVSAAELNEAAGITDTESHNVPTR